MPEEVCSHCKQPKPIVLVLRSKEDTLLCRDCGSEWLNSDKEFPKRPQILLTFTPDKTSIKSGETPNKNKIA